MTTEVRKGYKQTEVGVIPEDWEVRELGNICFPSKSRINPITSTKNFKCVELEHLSQGTGTLLGYAQSKDLLSQKSVFEKGDVLFGKLRPYLKKYLFADFEGVCTTEIWVLKTNKGISNKFLYHLVQSDRIIEAANLSTGTKMPRSEWKTVAETAIALPTKSEQTTIATALSDADALIASLEKLIEKKRAIKQGAMQELLRPKEGWEVKRLGEIAEHIMVGIASSATHAYRESGIVMLRNQNIKSNFLDDNDLIFITPEYEITFKNKRLKKGDLITARTGYPGTTCLVPESYEGSQSFTTLITRVNDDSINTLYLCYYINSEKGKVFFEQNQIGGGQKNVNAATLKVMPVELPSKKSEQTHIATILSDMDSEITALEQKLAKYTLIKQGMMQELLTGKIRLI